MPQMQASFADRVTAHVDRSDELLDEIRRAATYLRQRQGYALWKLQFVTKLHKNSLLRLGDRTWVPKKDTMVALAKLVERANAHRRGQTFEFPARPGPGRPRLHPKLDLPAVAADAIHKLHPKPKRRRANGKPKASRKS